MDRRSFLKLLLAAPAALALAPRAKHEDLYYTGIDLANGTDYTSITIFGWSVIPDEMIPHGTCVLGKMEFINVDTDHNPNWLKKELNKCKKRM